MNMRDLIVIGSALLFAALVFALVVAADKRRRRAFAVAGSNQGFQPVLPGEIFKIGFLPILEHKHHVWGQVLRGSWGAYQVLLFDYEHFVGKDRCGQTVVAFHSESASFPKFQLRKHSFIASAGWGAYDANRVQFETDPAFNKDYWLTGPEPKALADFFHPSMREFLVSLPDHTWAIEGDGKWLALYRHGKKARVAALFDFVQSAGPIADQIFGLAKGRQPGFVHENSANERPEMSIQIGGAQSSSVATSANMKFKFKVGSKPVSMGQMSGAIQEEIFKKTKEQLNSKLEGIRCQEHNQSPRLEFEGQELNKMKIHIKACCESQRQQATAALGSLGSKLTLGAHHGK